VHLDADVLDDDIMPAVDYRLPGGLGWDEVAGVLRAALATGLVTGVTVTILNPDLDPAGEAVRGLVACLSRELKAA
jgi:arginase